MFLAGNVCFHGSCVYYCDTAHPVCGKPHVTEGALVAYLPQSAVELAVWRHPWKRSYHKRRTAEWERNPDFCSNIFLTERRLLDLVDLSILDFFIGNMDRHHYETFAAFGNESFIVHLDQGKGYGIHMQHIILE